MRFILLWLFSSSYRRDQYAAATFYDGWCWAKGEIESDHRREHQVISCLVSFPDMKYNRFDAGARAYIAKGASS